jgi:Aerotolerance regulator N-terminal/von Willebrand factor type A domain
MTFLSPLFLLGAIAAGVPIVLHLLKREPEARIKFAAVKMLKHAPVEHTARHRLRELLLLALRVATLLLLALAFARPFILRGGAATVSGIRIVALDTSFSMSVPGRFAMAQQTARDAVSQAAIGELVGVVTFADDATIAAPPSADHVLATSTIDLAEVGFGATRYRAALSAAVQALAGRRGTIVVVTDLQESGWDAGDRAVVPEGTTVQIADVGAVAANLGVASIRSSGERIVAAIYNAGAVAREAHAHLSIDGRGAGDANTTVGPRQTGEVVFPAVGRGSTVAVSVDDNEGAQADNVRYARLGGSGRPSVLVVTGSGVVSREAFYVQHALTAGDVDGRSYRVASTSGSQLSATGDPGLNAHAAVMLLSTRGLERRGREALAAYVGDGGGLFIAAGPDVDGEVAADVLGGGQALRIVSALPGGESRESRTFAPADVRHPVFLPFSGGSATLGLVRFQRAAHIDGPGCQTLARFTTGDKALIECAVGEGHALVLASDLENRWNDFPLHSSFLPFIHESVRYLASSRSGDGEYVVGNTPAGIPKRPGVHQVAAAKPGQPARTIVVNVDPREMDNSRISAEEFQAAVAPLRDTAGTAGRVEARQLEDDQHLWQYALALMVLLLAVEGVLAARTA